MFQIVEQVFEPSNGILYLKPKVFCVICLFFPPKDLLELSKFTVYEVFNKNFNTRKY